MSYSFAGGTDKLTGSFTSTYPGEGLTLGCFIKLTHPNNVNRWVFGVGNNSSANTDSQAFALVGGANDDWMARSENGAASSNQAIRTQVIDGVWTGCVVTFTSATRRDVYIGSIGNTASNTGNIDVAEAIQHITVGVEFTGVNPLTGLIAECAVWDSVLSSADIISYINGASAAQIDAANLIGYWPLSASNSTQSNLGVDAGGDLTVTGATFSTDHPAIITSVSNATDTLRVVRSGIRLQ